MISLYAKSYRDLLSQVDEPSLARFYLSMEVGKKYKSFFRKDPKPSASLYFSNNGRLRYNDFVNNLSISDTIQQVYNLTYNEFLKRVSKDFQLQDIQTHNTYKKVTITSRLYNKTDNNIRTTLQIKKRELKPRDIKFWNQYNITKEWLGMANICPIEYFWINNKKGKYFFRAEKYSYSYNYYFYKNVFLRKIYQPYSKNDKWYSNINSTVVQGWNLLPKMGGDTLITTSSLKDVGTIYCNTTDIYGLDKLVYSVAPNNETSFFPEPIIPKLNTRFKRKLVWFDQDQGGHIGAKRFEQKYGWNPIFIPERCGVKDPSDFVKKYGKREFINLLKYLLNE